MHNKHKNIKYQNWFSEQYRTLMSFNKDIKVSGIVPFLKLMTLPFFKGLKEVERKKRRRGALVMGEVGDGKRGRGWGFFLGVGKDWRREGKDLESVISQGPFG